MPLEGQWERQSTPLRFSSPAARRALLITAVVVAVLVAVLVWTDAGAQAPHRAGCVDVTLASTTGGATFHACGQDARRWCAEHRDPASAGASAIATACRREGYPVG